MPYYKAQHETFIRALIRHGDQLLAYREAYPQASKESAYTAAIRLMRRPLVQARVAEAMLRHRQQEQQWQQQREERRRQWQEEDILRRRIWLAKVVRGEVECKRYFQVRGQAVLVYDTLSPFITLAAIELDTKYECGYSPKIILDRQFDRLYARANRVVGLCWINRANGQTGNNGHCPTGAVISNEVSVTERREKSPANMQSATPQYLRRFLSRTCGIGMTKPFRQKKRVKPHEKN